MYLSHYHTTFADIFTSSYHHLIIILTFADIFTSSMIYSHHLMILASPLPSICLAFFANKLAIHPILICLGYSASIACTWMGFTYGFYKFLNHNSKNDDLTSARIYAFMLISGGSAFICLIQILSFWPALLLFRYFKN